MKVEAKIIRTYEGRNLKALADIVIDEAIVIHNVRLFEKKFASYIGMPSEKWKDDKGQKRFRAICHPISLSAGNAIYVMVNYIIFYERLRLTSQPFNF